MSSLKIFKLPDKTLIRPNGRKIEILSNFIPPVIIGRGALLKCGEKKVSRTHASIDWDDDGILITSTHVTPTYINVNGLLKILNKGESSVLKNGDQFGLLADSFWYEISMSSDSLKNNNEKMDTETPCTSNNGNGILDISLKSSVESDERNQTHESNALDGRLFSDVSEQKILTKECASADLKIEQSASPVAHKEASFLSEQKNCDEPEEISKTMKYSEAFATELCRQRKLPTWLLCGKTREESKDVDNKVMPHVKHGGNVRKSKITLSIQDEGHFQNTEDIKKNIVKRVTPVKKDLGNVSKKKQYHSISQEYDVFSDIEERKEGVVRDIPNQKSDCKLDFESNDLNKNVALADVVPISTKYEKDSPIRCNENLHGVSDDDSASGQSPPVMKNTSNSLPLNVSAPANEKYVKRPIGEDIKCDEDNKKLRLSCLFGSNCYRRNPLHKNEYSHPGDEDYVPPDDDDDGSDDERLQCEHGIDCYRKNPKHRKAYKHTRIPQPKRQAARAKRKRDDDDDNDSENEYDADDPFLNDDSSDDYAPTDDDTDSPVDDAVEEEDKKRMIKEAKKFTKNYEG